MKDKRKKKDRTWAEAARLVRTAPRPPSARPAGPAARPAPAAAAETATSSPRRRPLAGLLLFVILREWARPGAPVCVRARAEGRSDYLGEPRARSARDRPGHFSRYFALGARLCLRHG